MMSRRDECQTGLQPAGLSQKHGDHVSSDRCPGILSHERFVPSHRYHPPEMYHLEEKSNYSMHEQCPRRYFSFCVLPLNLTDPAALITVLMSFTLRFLPPRFCTAQPAAPSTRLSRSDLAYVYSWLSRLIPLAKAYSSISRRRLGPAQVAVLRGT